MNEEVTISVASGGNNVLPSGEIVAESGRALAGWEDVEITLRAEGFPPTFRLSTSDGMPGGRDGARVSAGDRCFVRLGDDLVVTGYVTEVRGEADERGRRIEIGGRGKTQDLVDCEIEWDPSQVYLTASVQAVETIASYFGVEVRTIGAIQPLAFEYPIPLDFATTAADYLNRITRALGVLAYEASDGALVLAAAGSRSASSGAVYGQNVESFSLINSMDRRFSEVVATYYRQNQFLEGADDSAIFFHRERDPNVPRHRVRHVFLEAGPEGEQFAIRMAKWQVAREAARGNQVRVTVDSWRDKAGKLWEPNTLVPVSVPGLRTDGKRLCLSEVTFRRNNGSGTTAELMLLPVEGFTPEPVQLSNLNFAGVVAGGTSAGAQ